MVREVCVVIAELLSIGASRLSVLDVKDTVALTMMSALLRA